MAPLPVESTNRLWVRKQGITGTHEVMFRGQDGSNAIDLVNVAEEFCTATTGLVYEADTWVSARYAAAGDINSFPVTWTPIAGTNGGLESGFNKPYFVDFIGRSPGGRRVRWSIQGAAIFTDNNYRAVIGENGGVDAGIIALNTSLSILAAIDGLPPIIYSYADIGFNAYQQRKQRRS